MLKSIVCTYPDFRMLPKGVKQMLVASENLFFNEVSGAAAQCMGRDVERNRARLWQPPTRRLTVEGTSINV